MSAAVASHPRSGRVEPTRIAVRVADATVAPGPDVSHPLAFEAPLEAGDVSLGDVRARVEWTGGDARVVFGMSHLADAALCFVRAPGSEDPADACAPPSSTRPLRSAPNARSRHSTRGPRMRGACY